MGEQTLIDRAFSAGYNLFILSGSNSVVECDLAKVEVAGSTPVSRSIFCPVGCPSPLRGFMLSGPAQDGLLNPGAVPKW